MVFFGRIFGMLADFYMELADGKNGTMQVYSALLLFDKYRPTPLNMLQNVLHAVVLICKQILRTGQSA